MENYKELNIRKLEVARAISENGGYEIEGKQIKICDPEIEVFEIDDIDVVYNEGYEVEKIVVEENDSIGYVTDHKEELSDDKILLLNFANPLVPGGGVRRGCRAQEEDICRRSNLLVSLESDDASEYYETNKGEYELGYLGFERGVISRDVSLFVDSNGEYMSDPITVDILTVAAPYKNKNEYYLEKCNDSLIGSIDRIIEMILDYCQVNGYKNIILGAFGCGAFGNDPNTVARLFREYLESGKYDFYHVAFPILVKKEGEEENLHAFQNELG